MKFIKDFFTSISKFWNMFHYNTIVPLLDYTQKSSILLNSYSGSVSRNSKTLSLWKILSWLSVFVFWNVENNVISLSRVCFYFTDERLLQLQKDIIPRYVWQCYKSNTTFIEAFKNTVLWLKIIKVRVVASCL